MADVTEEEAEMQQRLHDVSVERAMLRRFIMALEEKASHYFNNDVDDVARIFRSMAKEWKERAENAEKEHRAILKRLHPNLTHV